MTYSDENKKEFQKMVMVGVGLALEEIVLPRFDQIDKKFDQIDKRFDKIDKKFEEVDERLDSMDAKTSRIERKLDQVTDHQAEKLDDHGRRLKLVETAMTT